LARIAKMHNAKLSYIMELNKQTRTNMCFYKVEQQQRTEDLSLA